MHRAAFAVMIKYSSLQDELEEILPEVETFFEMQNKDLSHEDKLIEVRLSIKADPTFKKLFDVY